MESRNLPSLRRVVDELSKFPGVGRKTALRLALYLLRSSRNTTDALTQAIDQLKENVSFCSTCNAMTEQNPCPLCTDPKRQDDLLCVVSKQQDLMALERSSVFRGRYHVLQGVLSPLNGIGPEEIGADRLLLRIRQGAFKEVILAMGFDVEGDATALYLANSLSDVDVRMTRLAHGIPVGGDLEYVDEATVNQAVLSRRDISD